MNSQIIRQKRPEKISNPLVILLEKNKARIISLWIGKLLAMPGSHYQKLSSSEINRWVLQGMNSILAAIKTGDYRQLDVYLAEISFARLEASFPISEVIEGLLYFKEATLGFIQENELPSEQELLLYIGLLDECLRQVVSQFGQTYANALKRQYNLEIQHNLAESESLQKITSALLHKLTTNEVLEIVCTEAQRLTGATGSSISLISDEGGLQVTFSNGYPVPSLSTQRFQGRLQLLG